MGATGKILLIRAAGCVLGVVLAAWMLQADPGGLGRGVMFAPLVFGACTLFGVVAAELLVPAPRAPGVRAASLTARRLGDYSPVVFTSAVAGVLIVLFGVLALTTLTASPDDLGRAGRSLARACSATVGASRGPYPGSFYSVPLLIGLLGLLMIAAWAARRALLRGRGAASDSVDFRRRRQSIRAIVAGVGVAASATLVGVSFLTHKALLGHECPAGWWIPTGWIIFGLTFFGLGMLAWSLGLLLAPVGNREDPGERPARTVSEADER